jgi:hypothetical protein
MAWNPDVCEQFKKERYPTAEHRAAADAAAEFFQGCSGVDAVLLTCSCARGKATRDSCLDLAVLLDPQMAQVERCDLERAWESFAASEPSVQALQRVGRYSLAEVDFTHGQFSPQPRHWTSGPDEFELAIGNTFIYSVSLWEANDRFRRLRASWLPYYDENLRRERLAAVQRYGLNNLDHIRLFVERGLYFQSFRRLYDASREFLQGLFIARQVYPIAYDKWIREQVVEILGEPEIYHQLVQLFEIRCLESTELVDKAEVLRGLFEDQVVQ